MHPLALDRCAAALGVAAAEVEQLHDQAELLPALLATIALRLGGVRSVAERPALARSILSGWGGTPVSAADLLVWSAQATTPQQREVGEAVSGAVGNAEPTARRLGMVLRELANGGPVAGVIVEAVGTHRGVQLWQVRDLQD